MKKIILLIIPFLLTGCFNYTELNNLAVITSIGIDKKDNYNISLLISLDTESNTIVTGEGSSLSTSFEDAIKKLSKSAYFGHLNLVLINSSISEETITDIIDFLVRNYETVKKLRLVLVSDTTTFDILNVPTKLSNFSSNNILSILSNSNNKLSNSCDVLLSDFVYKLINYGYDNILPIITLDNDNIIVKNIGIFSKDKLVGTLDSNLSKILNILTNKTKSFNIDLDDITIKIDSSKTKIKLNNLEFLFDIYLDGFILESSKDLEFDEKTINIINETLKNKIYNLTDLLIKRSISLNSDFLGLGNKLYKKNYNLYKDTPNYLKNINYKINIHSNIRNQGSIENSLGED